MTLRLPAVLKLTKGPGGTIIASIQILTVYTWMDHILLQALESTGVCFEASTIH